MALQRASKITYPYISIGCRFQGAGFGRFLVFYDEDGIGKLSKALSKSLKETSEVREMKFKNQKLHVQCIIPRHSKPIIDEIDQLLARHYGFSDEELDLIINYDLKYRIGIGTSSYGR